MLLFVLRSNTKKKVNKYCLFIRYVHLHCTPVRTKRSKQWRRNCPLTDGRTTLCYFISQLSASKQQSGSTKQETLRPISRIHWLLEASVTPSPAFSLRTRLGWVVGLNKSVVGVREGRGRDDLTDEIAKKRKRRRASTHTKQCSPKAKAPRCRRTAKHEKSKPRNVYYCVFFASQVFPSCSLLFAGQASERRFPLTENGIEWTALSPRHSFPELCFCYPRPTAGSLHLRGAIPSAVWSRFNRRSCRIFFRLFLSRARGGENNNTVLPLSTLFSLLRSVFISLSPITATRILYLTHSVPVVCLFILTFHITMLRLL